MTEAEWLACDDVEQLLETYGFLAPPYESDRRWRLFALACIESIRPHLSDYRLTAALDVIARDAEGDTEPHELPIAHDEALAAHASIWEDASEQRWFYVSEAAAEAVISATDSAYAEFAPDVCRRCADALALAADDGAQEIVRERAHRRHVALVHEIFGNPFRPVELDPLWHTFDVLALARGIYDDRAFDRMPILADALQDADCNNENVLTHCRD